MARQAMTSASHWFSGANQIGAVIPAVTIVASAGRSFIYGSIANPQKAFLDAANPVGSSTIVCDPPEAGEL